MNKKGQIMFYLLFIIVAIVTVLIGAVVFPMGTLINTKLYGEGAKLIQQSNASISTIKDSEVKAELQGVFASALASQQDNITVTTSMYQYSWLFVLIVVVLVIFIFTRKQVEYNQGGYV